jgi:hypothetical protein
MAKQKKFLAYKGVTLYVALKDDREYAPWYALTPNTQVEGADNVFDIRRLPKKYRRGLKLELDLSEARAAPSAGYAYEYGKATYLMEQNAEVHRDVFRRAIDDGYDFNAVARGNYSQFLRRLDQWMKTKFRAKLDKH